MYQTIQATLQKYNISGDIILYRDSRHKKAAMCEYLAQKMSVGNNTLCLYSTGAFGLYMAKAFPNNSVVICGHDISAEYKSQIETLPNATMVEGVVFDNAQAQAYAAEHGYQFVNQFNEPLIKAYYKAHFADILAELNSIQINAFCDCGHSCATLAGFIESGLANYEFILGVNMQADRTNLHYLIGKETMFTQEKTYNFDTAVLQTEIEAAYPTFGNVYEATRSISAAMSWLQKNPNKTVLVYVGDSKVFGNDA